MERSRAVVDRLAAGDDPIYAVNTGVGLLAGVRIPREQLDQLQRNVVRSHAAGVGEPRRNDAPAVRAAAACRRRPAVGPMHQRVERHGEGIHQP